MSSAGSNSGDGDGSGSGDGSGDGSGLSLYDLGADDLDVIAIGLAVEDAFDQFEIPDEAAEQFKTVGDLVAWVEGRFVGEAV
jgi:hypothetical protein